MRKFHKIRNDLDLSKLEAMDTNDIIDIALAADGGYFCGLFVTACSIAKHADKAASLRFNILDGGIAERDWELLTQKVTAYHSQSEFKRLPITGETFKDCLLWHGNHMTYARLLLPDLLPDSDYCIYCDVDFLWMRDISELWAQRQADIALISTYDDTKWVHDIDGKWLVENGFYFSNKDYICAGLTFFNLKYFREHGLHKMCFDLLKLKPPFNDQTVLYISTQGHRKLVPAYWQRIHQYVVPVMIGEGAVVHYAGATPWKPIKNKFGLMSDLMLLWHRMNAEAREITLWQSLRMYFGVGHILWHRGLRNVLYVLNRMHCLGPFHWLLVKTGHRGVWEYWERGMANMHMTVGAVRDGK